MADIQEVLDRALQLGEEGRWEEMAKALGEALEDEADDPYLLCWLGVAERELGNDSGAYDAFRRCVAQDPIDPNLLAVAGAGLAMFDDPEAESVLRAAALSGPEIPIARLQYGVYLAREGMFEDALEHLNAALELTPDDPAVHGEIGIAHALQGDMESAAEAFEDALDRAPDDAWMRVLLGLVCLELGRAEEAAEELVRASQQQQQQADAETDVLAALAAAAVGWDGPAQEALARAGFHATPRDERLLQEADDRVLQGPEAAQRMLNQTVAPSVLRERLSVPL